MITIRIRTDTAAFRDVREHISILETLVVALKADPKQAYVKLTDLNGAMVGEYSDPRYESADGPTLRLTGDAGQATGRS